MEKQAAQEKRLTFKQMSLSQKVVFVCKLTLSIVTFGFAFPNLMSD